jgi:hypothetical protein
VSLLLAFFLVLVLVLVFIVLTPALRGAPPAPLYRHSLRLPRRNALKEHWSDLLT